MTALAAVLGLVPLALAAGEPGSELLAPLAVVVLGGLVTSTFLNLVVVPAGFILIFGRSRRRRAGGADAGDAKSHREDGSALTPPVREPSF
jgi:Cu/Ag efflux pump CusA